LYVWIDAEMYNIYVFATFKSNIIMFLQLQNVKYLRIFYVIKISVYIPFYHFM